jgi:hypothetical protein
MRREPRSKRHSKTKIYHGSVCSTSTVSKVSHRSYEPQRFGLTLFLIIGNEAKFVLISVVRTANPGFLTSLNRMNVMLTRCQAGLVVVTSRDFIHYGGSRTLLGRLAQHWEEHRGDDAWVEWRSVADESVDLPGAPGRNKNLDPFRFANRPAGALPPTPLAPLPSRNAPPAANRDAPPSEPDYSYAGVAAAFVRKHRYPAVSHPVTMTSPSSMQNRAVHQPPAINPYYYYPVLPGATAVASIPAPASPYWFLAGMGKSQESTRPQRFQRRHIPHSVAPNHVLPKPKVLEPEWRMVENKHGAKKYSLQLTRSSYIL